MAGRADEREKSVNHWAAGGQALEQAHERAGDDDSLAMPKYCQGPIEGMTTSAMKHGRNQMFSAMQTKLRLSTASLMTVMARTVKTEMTVLGTVSRLAITVEKPRPLNDSCRYDLIGTAARPKLRRRASEGQPAPGRRGGQRSGLRGRTPGR